VKCAVVRNFCDINVMYAPQCVFCVLGECKKKPEKERWHNARALLPVSYFVFLFSRFFCLKFWLQTTDQAGHYLIMGLFF